MVITRLTVTATKKPNSTQASEWTFLAETEQNEKSRKEKFGSLTYLGLTLYIISPLLVFL